MPQSYASKVVGMQQPVKEATHVQETVEALFMAICQQLPVNIALVLLGEIE
jgi:hypothetical protein